MPSYVSDKSNFAVTIIRCGSCNSHFVLNVELADDFKDGDTLSYVKKCKLCDNIGKLELSGDEYVFCKGREQALKVAEKMREYMISKGFAGYAETPDHLDFIRGIKYGED